MSFDRNKSELTHNITRNVALWMDGKGFKPVETEVPVDSGWIADVAGVACPTQTELIELKLRKRPPKWRPERQVTYENEYKIWNEARLTIPNPMTAIVEVKTSRGDYMGDRKWTAAWPANLCYVAMPEGMIDPMHWPTGWGVILFSQDGGVVRKAFPPTQIQPVAHEQQLGVVLSIGVIRDHKTRYARLRELQREIRIKEGESTSICRISTAIRFVSSIVGGMEVEAAMNHHYMRFKLPEHVRVELEELRPKINA